MEQRTNQRRRNRLGRRAHKTQLVAVAGDFGTYRVVIPGADHPLADGTIDLIVHAELRQALALAPDNAPAIARRSGDRWRLARSDCRRGSMVTTCAARRLAHDCTATDRYRL